MNRIFYFFLFFLLFSGSLLWNPANGLSETGDLKISSTEDVVIAFYKTGGHQPDFERWIKERDPYRTTAPFLRPETMEKEMVRLKKAYASFDPQEDFLILKANIFARLLQETDKKNPEKTAHFLEMSFKAGEAGYFPYRFLDKRFAVVPDNLRDYLRLEIPEGQFTHLAQQLGNEGAAVTMILQLRPLKADMKAPYQVDGYEQWAFLTRIAAISVWDRAGRFLWEYTAPWYMAPLRANPL